jgi:hypothetical protein
VDKFSYEELMMKYLACKAHMKAREAGDKSKPVFSGKAKRQSSYAGDMEDDDDDSARYGEFDARRNNKPYVPRSDPGEPYSHNVPNLNPYYNEQRRRQKTQREMEDEEEELLYNRRPRQGSDGADKAKEKEREKAAKAREAAAKYPYAAYEAAKDRDKLNEFRRKLDSKYDAHEYDFSDKGYKHKSKAQVPSFGKDQNPSNPFNLPKQAPAGESSFVYNKTPRGSARGGAGSGAGSSSSGSSKGPKQSPRGREPDDLASNISVMGVGDLKRLMESKGISHDGCVEKIDLVEKLFTYFGIKSGSSGAPSGSSSNSSSRAASVAGGAPKRSSSLNGNSGSRDVPKVVKESSKFEFDHKPKEKPKARQQSVSGTSNEDSYVPSSGNNVKRNINQSKAGSSLYDRDMPSSSGIGKEKPKAAPSVLDPSNIPTPAVNNGLGHFVICMY